MRATFFHALDLSFRREIIFFAWTHGEAFCYESCCCNYPCHVQKKGVILNHENDFFFLLYYASSSFFAYSSTYTSEYSWCQYRDWRNNQNMTAFPHARILVLASPAKLAMSEALNTLYSEFSQYSSLRVLYGGLVRIRSTDLSREWSSSSL